MQTLHSTFRVLLLSALLAALTACGGGGGGSRLPDDPKEAILQAAHNQMENLPMRITVEGEVDGSSTSTTIEYESTQRMHMTMEGLEVILYDGSAWRNEGGSWVEDSMMASMAGSISGSISPEMVEEALGTVTEATLVGEEEIDGATARIYEYSASQEVADAGAETHTRMWVRESDGLPVKQVIESDMMGMQTTTTMTIEYDDAITVSPPQ